MRFCTLLTVISIHCGTIVILVSHHIWGHIWSMISKKGVEISAFSTLFASLASSFWVLIVVCSCTMWFVLQIGTFFGTAHSWMLVTTGKLLVLHVVIPTLYWMYMVLLRFIISQLHRGVPGGLCYCLTFCIIPALCEWLTVPDQHSAQFILAFSYLWAQCKLRAQWSGLKCTRRSGNYREILDFSHSTLHELCAYHPKSKTIPYYESYSTIRGSIRVQGHPVGDDVNALGQRHEEESARKSRFLTFYIRMWFTSTILQREYEIATDFAGILLHRVSVSYRRHVSNQYALSDSKSAKDCKILTSHFTPRIRGVGWDGIN